MTNAVQGENPNVRKLRKAAMVLAVGLFAAGILPAIGSAFAPVSAEGYSQFLRNGTRSVLVWDGEGEVRVKESCTVEVLMVGGGGGGGQLDVSSSTDEYVAGGGGAGGYVYRQELILTAGVYQVSVGAGGAVNACGGDTRAFGLVAYGGGNGGAPGGYPAASNGGSGGGATWSNVFGEITPGGVATDPTQGNRGGRSPYHSRGGGGGGAGAAGGDSDDSGVAPIAAGGEGRACSITGTEVWYAGGGGAYKTWDWDHYGHVSGTGGKGGGGHGGVAGTDGLGGGGGGYARGGCGTVILSFEGYPEGFDSASLTAEGFGQIFRNGDKSVVVWNENGLVTVTGKNRIVEVLMVGGGGGGGQLDMSSPTDEYVAGGGGAGGYVYRQELILTAGVYQVSVGAGGAVNACGGDTRAFGLVAYGGGNGGAPGGYPAASNGGSGGGATWSNVSGEITPGGVATDPTQGNQGGRSPYYSRGGGGGGAGAAGGDSDDSGVAPIAAGGEGRACSITGMEVWYAGGGGAYKTWDWDYYGHVSGTGGKGGGGQGGVAGTDGLGGGGGGYARGGSGTVILSFAGFPADVQTEFRDAKGGQMCSKDGYRIHSFAKDGAFSIPHAGVVDVLLVGGGGGGGQLDVSSSTDEYVAGGGGAGGYVYRQELILTAGVYQVSVGAGGAVNACGGDTRAFGLVAYGGGNGGAPGGYPAASNGGSGGGATWSNVFGEITPGGAATDPTQGNQGGRSPYYSRGGGGGGAGAAGGDSDDSGIAPIAAGGEGRACSITGTEVWYAGGGGAYKTWDWDYSGHVSGTGGKGGGGQGGVAGTDGLGGGGGGYARGGSGVVIIRYKKTPSGLSVIVR